MRKYLLHVLIISFVFLLMLTTYAKEQRITLRSTYKDLTVPQVQSMLNMSIRKTRKDGFFGHSTINHSYDLKSIDGDKVVIAHATGLMWHQSGSDNSMTWKQAKEWVENMNSLGHAGYNDWRLPTIEEAPSLLQFSKINSDLYIDPLFSIKQRHMWTGDVHGSEEAWGMDISDAGVLWSSIDDHSYFVRPVRSMK